MVPMPQINSPELVGQCALVADDDAIIRDIVSAILTEAGYDVVLATNGRETLDLASNLDAAVAIIDLAMPDGNGLQTCEALRQIPKWQNVPIIVLTSYPIKKALKASLAAGANGFLCKPFVADELLHCIAAHISKKLLPSARQDAERSHAESRRASTEQATPVSPAPTISK